MLKTISLQYIKKYIKINYNFVCVCFDNVNSRMLTKIVLYF